MKACRSLFLALPFYLTLLAPPVRAAQTASNPLISQRADPQICLQPDGNYYAIATVPEYDRIELRRARTLAGLATAEPVVVWRKHTSGSMASHIWAPELHFIDGKWYIYFSAGSASPGWDIRLWVLENAASDPFQGTWKEDGKLAANWESFTLDATCFEHKGHRYLVWAQKDPAIKGNTNLYIAEMDSPTSIKGKQVMLSRPELPWECVGYLVNEGPAVLIKNGKVFLTYSASATDHHYCMGLLTASAEADLLDPKSWVKSQQPVFSSSEANGQYGPGHNSFTTTRDGKTDVLVYHARNYKEIKGEPLHDPNRHTRVQIIHWKADGTPEFGEPVKDGPLPAELQD